MPLSSSNSTKRARIGTSGSVRVGVPIAKGAATEVRNVSVSECGVVPWIQLCIEEIGKDVEKGTSTPPVVDLQGYQSSILENQ